MDIVEHYDTLIGVCAVIAAVCMMVGTGLAVLALGIWAMKAALRKKP